MSSQHLASFAVLVVVIAVESLAPVRLAGQAPAVGAAAQKPAATRTWAEPRTPEGRPDLQGIWLNNDATPLERPKALEGKPFLTGEEVAALQKNAERLFGATWTATSLEETISFSPRWQIPPCTGTETLRAAASERSEKSITERR